MRTASKPYNQVACRKIGQRRDATRAPIQVRSGWRPQAASPAKPTNTRGALPTQNSEEAEKLYLGNLDAKRDWGFAKEYVEAMWMMLQQESPADYVIGTGETHSVREYVEAAFGHVNLDWTKYVDFDARYNRPAEVDALLADPSKARQQLGWQHQTGFSELVRLMVDAEIDAIERQRAGVLSAAVHNA